MFKKITLVILAVLFVMVFAAGCGSDQTTTQNTTANSDAANGTPDEIKADNYENTIAGLQKYLTDLTYISGESTKMSADLIGAKEGYRYTFNVNDGTTTIELYEYETDQAKQEVTTKEIIRQVTDTGEFVILDLEPVKAELLNNNRFLVVYKDTKLEENNPPEVNEQRKADIIKAIDEFYKK